MGIEGVGGEIAGMVRMDRFRGQPCPYSWSSRFPLCVDAPFHPAVPYRPWGDGHECARRRDGGSDQRLRYIGIGSRISGQPPVGGGCRFLELRWLDDDHLNVDLGKAKWLTPQIDHLGHVKISYTYSGAEPSLE